MPIDATRMSQLTATPPASYAYGWNYIPPQASGTTMIYASRDGVTWDDSVLLDPGVTTYSIPASVEARYVQCTTQATETFGVAGGSAAAGGIVTAADGRPLLMGTRIMSDVVEGPDH